MSAKNNSTQRVIIQTKGRPGLGLLNSVGILGGKVKQSFRSIDGFVAEIPAGQILRLSDNPGIAHISIDALVAASSDNSSIFDFGPESVGGDAYGTRPFTYDPGYGVGIAVIDSGLAPHADVPSDRIDAWKDFVNGRTSAYDDCGHGTHIAGIIIGSGKMSTGYGYTKTFAGIAPRSKLVVAKVLGADGSAYTSDVISAIDWVISIASAKHVGVINLSLGHLVVESYKTDPLCKAAERAVNAGIVVVASAGNAGPQYGTINSPGNDPAVITVGAVDTQRNALRSDDRLFYYSSRGPSRIDYVAKPDIAAPGNCIFSLRAKGSYLDTNYPENRVPTTAYSTYSNAGDPQYFVMSGTSAAAPMVAAAAALILQKAPGLEPNGVKAALMYSASSMTGVDLQPNGSTVKAYDQLTIGAGYLNIPGALSIARNIDTTKNVGRYWFRGYVMAGTNLVWGEPVLWTQNINWGNYTVSGNILSYNNANWDSGMWGVSDNWVGYANYSDDFVASLNPVWSANWSADPAEDSDAQVYGDNAIWGGRPIP